MKKILVLLAMAGLVGLGSGCSLFDPEGAIESQQAFASGSVYECEDGNQSDMDYHKSYSDVNIWGDAFTMNYYFTEGETCTSLGYTIKEYSFYKASSDGSLPGPYGHWGNGGSSGGTADASCTSSYQGVEDDSQLYFYCASAYAYLCMEPYQTKAKACATYLGMKATGGSYYCRYCE